jgi:putative membrane protein (TIGR04086 family)
MSSGFSALKWGRVVVGVIVGFLVGVVGNILLQTIYGVVLGFQARGMPPQDQMIAAIKSVPFQLLAALLVLLGGFVGGRMAARPAETNRQLAGLITGVLLAILVVIWRALSWGAPDLWMVIQAVLAILGGWLGGRLAARRTDEEYEELPHI